MLRTHTCGELTIKDIGKQIKLAGWVSAIRSHGKITFIDLRDRYGITQVVFDQKNLSEANKLKDEAVMLIAGKANERPEGTVNKNLSTGEVEVKAETLEIINLPSGLPFEINDRFELTEDLRLKYRYLDF